MTPFRRSPTARRVMLAAAFLALPALSGCMVAPELDEAIAKAGRLAESSKILAADGSLITTLHDEQDRELIPLSEVPEHVRRAVIAVEDERFYDHSGVDAKAVLRAMFVNTAEGKVVEGGSTITQQYIKNALIEPSRTLRRKLREAALAFQLERKYSKDEILERYLNTVYFGGGAYGIQAAAKRYFSVPASKLTVTQGALLAGLIKAPSSYDPETQIEAATVRRNLVLRKMREQGYLTAGQEGAARKGPVRLKAAKDRARYPHAYFVDYVKELVQRDPRFDALGEGIEDRVNALFKGGLRIYTTLDPKLQRLADQASRSVLTEASDPYNAFVAMTPKDGAIVAMVGGRDFFADPKLDPYAKFNLAWRGRRQPGSSFKTFTLIAALEKGISLGRIYRGGSSITIRQANGQLWPVRNYESLSFGSRLSLRQATVKSVNVVYAQVVNEIGAQAVVDVARKMGITSPLKPLEAIALGAQEVSPLEQANAYATLAAGGMYTPAMAIRRITDSTGALLYEAKPSPKRVVDEAIASTAIDALQDVMTQGTGRRVQLDRPSAGKTGTADEYRDAWFAGFTPQYVGVSWVGFPQGQISMTPPRTRIRVVGGSWPGKIWQQFMLPAHRGLPEEPFPEVTRTFVRVRVDTLRGCLPNRFTPEALIATRSFVSGSEPTEVCAEPSSAEIRTPGVVGKTEAVARATLERAGFRVTVLRRSCPAYLEGTVCEQTPAAGTEARVGDNAVVTISDDTAAGGVPRVLGLKADRAEQKLRDHGFGVRVVVLANEGGHAGCRTVDEARSGRVWLQNPCADERANYRSTVTIYVNP